MSTPTGPPRRSRGATPSAMAMKASCERCGAALPPDADARVCSYECTFCADCAEAMNDKCPNCGGELASRTGRSAESAPKV